MSSGSANQPTHTPSILKPNEPIARTQTSTTPKHLHTNFTHPGSAGTMGASGGPVNIRTMTTQYNAQLTSARLFEIALQARVANADASRTETDKTDSNQANRKPTVTSNQNRSVHLTPQQWQLLTDYHEHDLFVRTRSWSFCLAIFGVGVALFGIGSPAWKWIGEKLHTSIICLLGCACLFGLLGLGLAITGVCRSALILRLYYYHSAGECFLVSSICTVSSLILFPFSAEACIQNLLNHNLIHVSPKDTSEPASLPETRFGYTYFLTWIAALFFLNSFICMNLDLIIQSFVTPVPIVTSLIHYCTPCHLCQSQSETHRSKPTNSNRSSSNTRTQIVSTSHQNPCHTDCQESDSTKFCRQTSSVGQCSVEFKPQQPIPEIRLSDYDQECEEPVESIDADDDGDWI